MMFANRFFNVEDVFGKERRSYDGWGESSALVIHDKDSNFEFMDAYGCSWRRMCCEPLQALWIGTTRGWIGTTTLGIGYPLELRIGMSSPVELHGSVHESLKVSTRHCLARAWTLMCSTCSWCMSKPSCWPLTSCAALVPLVITLLVNKFNVVMRRRRMKNLSHCRGPYRRTCRWNGTLSSIYEDERQGFPGHVRSDIGHGCSSGYRSSWKDHGIVYSSYISCNHCKPDAGSFQRWWKRKWITVWRWSQTSSST